ncbi:MAG: hypothetical protein R3B93_07255 [Bacteroidia bacterium]
MNDTTGVLSLCELLGFLTATATRAVIFIEADNPKIGLVCFMAMGMAEAFLVKDVGVETR